MYLWLLNVVISLSIDEEILSIFFKLVLLQNIPVKDRSSFIQFYLGHRFLPYITDKASQGSFYLNAESELSNCKRPWDPRPFSSNYTLASCIYFDV